MPIMTRISVLCLVVAFACFVETSLAAPAPVIEAQNGNEVLDEIISRLKQMKIQSEEQFNFRRPSSYGNSPREEIFRVHRTLDNLGGGYLLKRSLEPLGGGYLLKRGNSDIPKGTLDSLGGGYLL